MNQIEDLKRWIEFAVDTGCYRAYIIQQIISQSKDKFTSDEINDVIDMMLVSGELTQSPHQDRIIVTRFMPDTAARWRK